MTEYQLKLRVYTGNLLPPYYVDATEVYEAPDAQTAIAKAKIEYEQRMVDAEEYPLIVREVTKL